MNGKMAKNTAILTKYPLQQSNHNTYMYVIYKCQYEKQVILPSKNEIIKINEKELQ